VLLAPLPSSYNPPPLPRHRRLSSPSPPPSNPPSPRDALQTSDVGECVGKEAAERWSGRACCCRCCCFCDAAAAAAAAADDDDDDSDNDYDYDYNNDADDDDAAAAVPIWTPPSSCNSFACRACPAPVAALSCSDPPAASKQRKDVTHFLITPATFTGQCFFRLCPLVLSKAFFEVAGRCSLGKSAGEV
jgi:hypothetical protein